MNANNFIQGIIDRLEENFAIIRLEEQQTLVWPIHKLPDNIGEGDQVSIFLNSPLISSEPQSVPAKDIINEILNSN